MRVVDAWSPRRFLGNAVKHRTTRKSARLMNDGRRTCRPLQGLSFFDFGFYKDCAPGGAGRGHWGGVTEGRRKNAECRMRSGAALLKPRRGVCLLFCRGLKIGGAAGVLKSV